MTLRVANMNYDLHESTRRSLSWPPVTSSYRPLIDTVPASPLLPSEPELLRTEHRIPVTRSDSPEPFVSWSMESLVPAVLQMSSREQNARSPTCYLSTKIGRAHV